MASSNEARAQGRTRWFDRTFARVDAGHLYWIVERLRGTPARIAERLDGLAGDVLVARHGERWSIQENVGHLSDLESLWTGRVEDFVAGAETLRPADLTNAATHAADHNAAPLAAILDRFRGQRAELVARLEALEPDVAARTALHPRLGTPMNVADLAFFVAEHDDHHMAEITDGLRASEESAG